MGPAFDLDRFVDAQAEIYDAALAELHAGRKRSHWMWFIFPQCHGLGSSDMSVHYAISSLDEARAYVAHPILGPRLVQCAEALLAHEGMSARDMLGTPDDLKLRSSATLFALVAGEDSVFQQLLARFFNGRADASTLALTSKRS